MTLLACCGSRYQCQEKPEEEADAPSEFFRPRCGAAAQMDFTLSESQENMTAPIQSSASPPGSSGQRGEWRESRVASDCTSTSLLCATRNTRLPFRPPGGQEEQLVQINPSLHDLRWRSRKHNVGLYFTPPPDQPLFTSSVFLSLFSLPPSPSALLLCCCHQSAAVCYHFITSSACAGHQSSAGLEWEQHGSLCTLVPRGFLFLTLLHLDARRERFLSA